MLPIVGVSGSYDCDCLGQKIPPSRISLLEVLHLGTQLSVA